MSRQHRTIVLASILLVTGAIHAPAIRNGFTMDDRLVAMPTLDSGEENRLISQLRPLGEYFAGHYWQATEPDRGDLYRPVTILSYALVQAALLEGSGEMAQARAQHLVNVLLHLAATALVYVMCQRVLGNPTASLAAAAVFGLHAIHSEVVAGVVGRAELLAFVLGALGASSLLGTDPGRTGRLWVRGIAASFAWFLAFASKESALAWVPFFMALAAARGSARGANLVEQFPRKAVVASCAGALSLLVFLVLRERTLAALQGPPAVAYIVNPLWHVETTTRVLSAVRVWGFGMLLTAFPFSLAADYGFSVFEIVRSPWDPGFLATSAIFLCAISGGIVARRSHPELFLATSSFYLFSFITSNVPFAIGTTFAERLYYSPSLAAAFVAAWIASRRPTVAWLRAAVAIGGGAWLGANALVVLQRNPVWMDDATLFTREALSQPDSARMSICAATVREEAGEMVAAENSLKRAVEIDPECALAWNNLGALYLSQGLLGDAEYCLERGLSAAHQQTPADTFKLHCNLGLVLSLTGRIEEAAEELDRSLELAPGFLRTRIERLNVLAEDFDEARFLELLEGGEHLFPMDSRWAIYRGILAFHRRDWPMARWLFEVCLQEDSWPSWVPRDLVRLLYAEMLLSVGERDSGCRLLRILAGDAAVRGRWRRRADASLSLAGG